MCHLVHVIVHVTQIDKFILRVWLKPHEIRYLLTDKINNDNEFPLNEFM